MRTWLRDIQLWIASTELDAAKHGPTIAMRLTGAARDHAREIDVQTLISGDPSQNLTGAEVLLRALKSRFSPLEQELQLYAAHELMAFRRQAHESIDEMLSRYELVVKRAQTYNFDLPAVGRAYYMLVAAGVPIDRWPLLLSSTNGLLPNNEAELVALVAYLRRNCHLFEKSGDAAKHLKQYFCDDSNHDSTYNLGSYLGSTYNPDSQDLTYNSGSYHDPTYNDAVYTVDTAIEDDYDFECDWDSNADLGDVGDMQPEELAEQLYLQPKERARASRRPTLARAPARRESPRVETLEGQMASSCCATRAAALIISEHSVRIDSKLHTMLRK